jgi:hypothetical protein
MLVFLLKFILEAFVSVQINQEASGPDSLNTGIVTLLKWYNVVPLVLYR